MPRASKFYNVYILGGNRDFHKMFNDIQNILCTYYAGTGLKFQQTDLSV